MTVQWQRAARAAGILAASLLVSASAFAQVQTGEIFGRVTDSSGAAVPGVTVTLESPSLIQPRTAVTADTGAYRFASLPVGVYAVTFEVSSFARHVRRDVRIETGFAAEVSPLLQVSSVQETIEVTGVTPVVDTKSTTLGATFNREMLERLPSARDPWVILEQMPGMVLDRQNVGGNQSGQQSGFITHGSGINEMWNIDGATVTDMVSGGSPTYYDFDSFEEIQVQTGGNDASFQSGGTMINIVTKSGSNVLKGSGRIYLVDQALQSSNATPELRAQGAGSGNPIKNIKEYGFEAGGPILRNRAWFWGSAARQDIGVGVIGFLRPGATDPNDVDSLETDITNLTNYAAKTNYQWTSRHKSTFYWGYGDKYRGSRGVGPLTRIEAAVKQTSPGNTFKVDHQWLPSDRLAIEAKAAYVQNHFLLDFTSPELDVTQGAVDIDSGLSYRSGQRTDNDRPGTDVRADANYFAPSFFGGDHTIKVGVGYHHSPDVVRSHYGGYVTGRFRNGVGIEADMRRDSLAKTDMLAYSAYVNDSYRKSRLTVNLGLRFDYQDDKAEPSSIPANPIIPDLLPAIDFAGVDTGIEYRDVSPRFGITYDLSGKGKTVLKGNLARYYGLGIYTADQLNPVRASRVRFPWTDRNGDSLVQREELDLTRVLNFANWNRENPSAFISPNRVDPNLGNDITDEALVTLEHELMPNFSVAGTYIYKQVHNQQTTFTLGVSSADYIAREFTADCGNSTCSQPSYTATYFELPFTIPSGSLLRNYNWDRVYNGIELTARKRFSGRWMMQGSVVFNDTTIHYRDADAYQDPTNVAQRNGAQTGTLNTRWVAKLSGLYVLPYGLAVSGFLNLRDGVPFDREIQSPTRTGALGRVDAEVGRYGDERYPNFFQADFRVEKTVRLRGAHKLLGYVDVFNLTNGNIVLARVTRQNTTLANNVTQVLAPRVVRFGLRYQF